MSSQATCSSNMSSAALWFSTEPCIESLSSKATDATVSLIGWLSFYCSMSLVKPSISPEWRCRTVTFVHGIAITIFAYYSQFIEGPVIFGVAPGLTNNQTQNTLLKMSLGYFIFDLTWCLIYQTEDPIMIVHHLLSLWALIMSLFENRWGCELVGTLGGTEITNPLLQTRWFLREINKHKTVIGEIVDLSFILVFGYVRLYIGSFILFEYYFHPRKDFLGRLGGVTIYALSWVFMFYILRYSYRKYSRMLFPMHRSKLSGKSEKGTGVNNGKNHAQ